MFKINLVKINIGAILLPLDQKFMVRGVFEHAFGFLDGYIFSSYNPGSQLPEISLPKGTYYGMKFMSLYPDYKIIFFLVNFIRFQFSEIVMFIPVFSAFLKGLFQGNKISQQKFNY